MLKQIDDAHPGKVRVILRHFPLFPIYNKTFLASQAAEAAGAQGYFWEMAELLFDSQAAWHELSPQAFLEWLEENSLSLSLNHEQFMEDLNAGKYVAKIEQDFSSAFSAGLVATPTVFINGTLLQYASDLSVLEAAIRLELLEARKIAGYPPSVISSEANYFAHLHFNLGEVTLQLYTDSAPLAVNNFVFLTRQGWYDDNPVFRVIPGKLVELGDPSGTGLGDPGYYYQVETDPMLRFDRAGMVALSSSGPDTNSSRFFITLTPYPELDGSRTIFGRVIAGLEIFSRLQARDPLSDLLTPPEAILHSITIEEE